MHNPTHIAIFRPHDKDLENLRALLSRHSDHLSIVESLSDLRQLLHQPGRPLEVVAIPSRLSSGASGMSTCLSLKADPELSSLPVLAVALVRDLASIEALFSYGADLVIAPPFDAELAHLQIKALARQRRAYSEALAQIRDGLGLTQASIEALDCAREGLLVFDKQKQPLFVNLAARRLLGLREEDPITSVAYLASLLDLQTPQALVRCSINRVSGQRFSALVRSIPILGEASNTAGFALGISNAAELDQLQANLVQAQRLRELTLLCAAGALHSHRGTPNALLERLKTSLEQEQPLCELDGVALILLEILDFVMSPGVSTRVDVPRHCKVAWRFSDAFRMLGLILLQAVEHAGVQGEVNITAQEHEPDKVRLQISSDSRHYDGDGTDALSELIQGYLSPPDPTGNKPLTGLEPAQKLAELYHTKIEYKKLGAKLKIRLDLVSGRSTLFAQKPA